MSEYQLVKFSNNEVELDVNVSPDEDTVWLSKSQISTLFSRDRSVISRHISNIYKEGELDQKTSCAKNAHEINGQIYYTEYYNLDVIISVGYRVKSKNGIIFRKWANKILTEYLIKGYIIDNKRVLITEDNYFNLLQKIDSLNNRLSKLEEYNIKNEIIFFDGEMFDAKSFLASLFYKASHSIILIDAYADIKALDFLKNKKENVGIIIYKSSKAKLSKQDIAAFNTQYGNCTVKSLENFHDRFVIIDSSTLYHLGASLNFAGKKAFAITKIEDSEILNSIKEKIKV